MFAREPKFKQNCRCNCKFCPFDCTTTGCGIDSLYTPSVYLNNFMVICDVSVTNWLMLMSFVKQFLFRSCVYVQESLVFNIKLVEIYCVLQYIFNTFLCEVGNEFYFLHPQTLMSFVNYIQI